MAGSPLARGADYFHVRATGAPWYGSRTRWERFWAGRGGEAWEALGPSRRINRGRLPVQLFWYASDVPEELRGTGTVQELQNWEMAARRWKWVLGDGRHYIPPGEEDAVELWREEFSRRAEIARKCGTNDARFWPGAIR